MGSAVSAGLTRHWSCYSACSNRRQSQTIAAMWSINWMRLMHGG